MAAYLEYVQELKSSFVSFEVVHVPREQNARADLLAKLARAEDGDSRNSEDAQSICGISPGSSDKQVDGESGEESQIFDSRDLEVAKNKSMSGRRGEHDAGLHDP